MSPKLAEYKAKSKRDKALEDTVQELSLNNFTVQGLRLKIKKHSNALLYRVAEVRESERSGEGTDDIYVPKLFFFFWFAKADSFLRTNK